MSRFEKFLDRYSVKRHTHTHDTWNEAVCSTRSVRWVSYNRRVLEAFQAELRGVGESMLLCWFFLSESIPSSRSLTIDCTCTILLLPSPIYAISLLWSMFSTGGSGIRFTFIARFVAYISAWVLNPLALAVWAWGAPLDTATSVSNHSGAEKRPGRRWVKACSCVDFPSLSRFLGLARSRLTAYAPSSVYET